MFRAKRMAAEIELAVQARHRLVGDEEARRPGLGMSVLSSQTGCPGQSASLCPAILAENISMRPLGVGSA